MRATILQRTSFGFLFIFLSISATWYLRRQALEASYQQRFLTYREESFRFRLNTWSSNSFVKLDSPLVQTRLAELLGGQSTASSVLHALSEIELPVITPTTGPLTVASLTNSTHTTKILRLAPESFSRFDTTITNQSKFDPLLHRASRYCRFAITIPYIKATMRPKDTHEKPLHDGMKIVIISGIIQSDSATVSPFLLEFQADNLAGFSTPSRAGYDINLVVAH